MYEFKRNKSLYYCFFLSFSIIISNEPAPSKTLEV